MENLSVVLQAASGWESRGKITADPKIVWEHWLEIDLSPLRLLTTDRVLKAEVVRRASVTAALLKGAFITPHFPLAASHSDW